MAMLSPGVEVLEIDASGIVPTVSNSIAVFGGSFTQGPTNTYTLITNASDLVTYYGTPTASNYNDWYQCKTFLDYGNLLLVSRGLSSTAANASYICQGRTYTTDMTTAIVTAANSSVIGNETDYENESNSIVFPSETTVVPVLKFLSKNPGAWGNDIQIAIAKPSDFVKTPTVNNPAKYAFSGISLNDQFDYFPGTSANSVSGYDEFAVIVKYKDLIVETFIVSFSTAARDANNKSMYVESLINSQSKYVYVKVNDAVAGTLSGDNIIDSYIHSNNTGHTDFALVSGSDGIYGGVAGALTAGEISNAYDIFSNKEEIDIDIIIANEGNILAGVNLAEGRQDCIAFIGATYDDTVGQSASDAVANIISWRTQGEANINSSYVVVGANYMNVYDKYADKYRWINVAGTLAGLRAQTNTNLASWWASAGLERGQLLNVNKLAFNPNQGQRDFLYKNGLNPIVSFPGQGVVLWGQKTLLDKPSSFDRVNVRGLFITLERALWKMAKYQVFEFNDSFTRNRISAMINPFLATVQAGRGIQDFLVVCDTTNNTPDIISRNQLIVDVYIKPTYVAEFIQLRFTNAGTNSFASIIGA